MKFDGDGDGKLDRDELMKFAEDMMARFRPGPGEPPPRERPFREGDAGKPEGEGRRPEGFGDRDRPPRGPDSGERPERPFRPDGDAKRPARGRSPDGERRPERPGRPRDDSPPPPAPLADERSDNT
jgi:hypothetical protein